MCVREGEHLEHRWCQASFPLGRRGPANPQPPPPTPKRSTGMESLPWKSLAELAVLRPNSLHRVSLHKTMDVYLRVCVCVLSRVSLQMLRSEGGESKIQRNA